MSQPNATEPITVEQLHFWAKEMENGNLARVLQEEVDENVESMFSSPADGPLGKTSPTSGWRVYYSRSAHEGRDGATLRSLCLAHAIKLVLYTVDILIQPPEMNPPSERHMTKAVFEMKSSATLKSTRKGWTNCYAYVFHFNNDTKKVVKIKVYQDSAAVNRAFED
ncbi:hypothetical protein FRB96_002315 [Tulasnella sp. 330]|nr:hypothetical protein FRB96_002315 [Tulasnella sp. 330]